MPTLYHHSMSSASRFVRLILAEYGFQADLVEEQPWEKRREFLTLNPAGTLPVYVDDSMRVLCGPSVLLEFLDETHGVLKRDRRLLAEDPWQRAEIRRLTVRAMIWSVGLGPYRRHITRSRARTPSGVSTAAQSTVKSQVVISNP